MQFKNRYALVAVSVLLTGILATGAAFASGTGGEAASGDASQAARAVKAAKARPELTEEQKALLGQIKQLRQSYMEKFKAERQGLIEKARQEGRITPEFAEKLNKAKGSYGAHGPHMHGRKGPMMQFKGDPEAMKAKIEAAVQQGKLTREQADAMLKRMEEMRSRMGSRSKGR